MFLIGCVNKNKTLKEDYFIGTWRSDDNAKIVLKKDGKGELFNFNFKNVDSISKIDSILNGDCEWRFVQIYGRDQVTITCYDGDTIQYLGKIVRTKFSINFNIGGTGLFGQSPPWNLYVFIGDPDDFNRYLFIKDK